MNQQCTMIVGITSLFAAQGFAADSPSAFEKEMKESVMRYRSGDVSEALTFLTKAKALLEKEQSTQVGKVLPDAPADWKAEEMKVEDLPAYLGGGKAVKKLYKAKKGQEEVQLEVFYGSSYIPLLRGMFANDAIAKAQGYKVKSAAGEKVLIKVLPGDNCEISMPLDDEVMIKLTGKDGAEEDMMLKLLREIDRRSLKSLVK